MKQLIKVLLFVSLGLFLYTRFTSGTLLFYIHQRFALLTLITALGLILVASSYLYTYQARQTHNHEPHSFSWLSLVLMALPVLLGVLVAPQPLGATALSNRELNMTNLAALASPQNGSPVFGTAGEKNILDWLYAFQQNPDPAVFTGQEAHIIGFVYRDERFVEDTFLVGRFVVSCCVADANPVGLVVRWPDAPTVADNQWVEVSGRFEAGSFDGQPTPILVVENLTLTDPPTQPYLYL